MRTIVVVIVFAVVGIGAAPAFAKERVEATLTTPIPLGTEEGEQVEVGWTLATVDENGARTPFGANGVFVQVRGTEDRVSRAFAPDGNHAAGEYSATVRVPAGGIRDVQVGLRGEANGRPSNLLFRVVNESLLTAPAAEAPTASGSGGSAVSQEASRPWILVALLAITMAATGGVVVLALRRRLVERRRESVVAKANIFSPPSP